MDFDHLFIYGVGAAALLFLLAVCGFIAWLVLSRAGSRKTKILHYLIGVPVVMILLYTMPVAIMYFMTRCDYPGCWEEYEKNGSHLYISANGSGKSQTFHYCKFHNANPPETMQKKLIDLK